ncbi:MAG: hypothetical protein IT574_08080 [Candidatus Aureabacteria bacterium]|nr:hypothetical protein [Candidatus Auribacterota bacterium]
MKRILVCSPFASEDPDVQTANVERVRTICRDVALAGDAPFAPHLLLPQFLRDDVVGEREVGLRAGLAWLPVADELWVYGAVISPGMVREIREAEAMGIPVRRHPA